MHCGSGMTLPLLEPDSSNSLVTGNPFKLEDLTNPNGQGLRIERY